MQLAHARRAAVVRPLRVGYTDKLCVVADGEKNAAC
jgi:hypothetical protein